MDQMQQIFLELQKLSLQMGRLVSDFESEKDFRKMRHADFEKRLRTLEDKYNEFRGKMVATIGLLSALFGAAVALIIKLL